jgi:hypothetical protein
MGVSTIYGRINDLSESLDITGTVYEANRGDSHCTAISERPVGKVAFARFPTRNAVVYALKRTKSATAISTPRIAEFHIRVGNVFTVHLLTSYH